MNLNQKYRPQQFSNVVGQDIIVNTLQKEIETNNLAPAYLFVGKSGSGKSTSARIMGFAINAHTIEIDAASHNNAEEMRILVDTIKQRPLDKDYCLVILDEAHILSSQAVQTLLLTLESPPSYVIFILCTTEVDKIPQTIYNRCEVFNFTPISPALIEKRLEYICSKEGLSYDKNTLSLISLAAEGSMRQAITYLEQGKSGNIKELLLASSFDTCMDMIYAVCDKDIKTIAELPNKINDINKFVNQLFSFLLGVNVYLLTNNIVLAQIPTMYEEDIKKLSTYDKQIVVKMRKGLYELQFEGRNNPVLKQLLISMLIDIAEG